MREKNTEFKNNNKIVNIIFFVMISIYPMMVVRTDYYSDLTDYPWYFGYSHQLDYFLQFRAWSLIVIGVMCAILVLLRIRVDKSYFKSPIWIVVSLYMICIIVSMSLSVNRRASIIGGIETYESVFVLIAYLLLTVFFWIYSDEFIRYTGKKIFMYQLRTLSVMILMLGMFQPDEVYLTFYNPDYASLFIVILILGEMYMFVNNKEKNKYIDLSLIIILMVLIYKTKCITNIAIMAFTIMTFCVCYFAKKNNMLNKLVTAVFTFVLLIMIVFLAVLSISDNDEIHDFQSISTEKDAVIVIKNNETYRFSIDEEISDDELDYKRCQRILDNQIIDGFSIQGPYEEMFFTYSDEDGRYLFVTGYKKFLDLHPASIVSFRNNMHVFGNRGYIWGVTLWKIREYLWFGCGPDAFTYVFPHNDYINSYNVGFLYNLITKPHSLYLQIAIQTGIISLICFVAFIVMVLINVFNDKEFSVNKLILLLALFAYLLSGFVNDSCVAIAPYMWILIGTALGVTKRVNK